jgi:hypothetical protein
MSNSERARFMQECYLLRLKAQLQMGGGFPEHLIKAVREDVKLLDAPEGDAPEDFIPGRTALGARMQIVLALELREMILETGGAYAMSDAVRIEVPQWLFSMFETLQGQKEEPPHFYGVPFMSTGNSDRLRVVYGTGAQKVPLHVVPVMRKASVSV